MTSQQVCYPSDIKLTSEQVKKFDAFAAKIAATDKTSAFSEQTLVALHQAAKNQDDSARLFAVLDHDIFLGAWVLIEPAEDQPGVVEGAVAPEYRGRGIASAILDFMTETADLDFSRYNAWVHQVLDDPSGKIAAKANHLVEKLGFKPVRDLRKMRLTLTDDARQKLTGSPVSFAPETELSLFNSQQDADAWVRLNAEAFAQHPEQGKLTRADLEERLAADWFRADGFFMLQTASKPAGYIWTKIPTEQSKDFEGEIYAVGVSPTWQGKGLGRALTAYALAHLATTEYAPRQLLDAVVLYVDAENTAAVTLYESLGFVNETIDIMYSMS